MAGRVRALTLGASKNGPQKRIGRPSDWTPAKAAKFVTVLADSCNVSLAARTVKRSIGDVYRQRAKDAAFRAAWDQALAIGYSRLEIMMLERALHGVEKVVVSKSGESSVMREYNDRVALALLRHHRETVLMVEGGSDDETHEEACERIIERLARLREQQMEQGNANEVTGPPPAPPALAGGEEKGRPLALAGGEEEGRRPALAGGAF